MSAGTYDSSLHEILLDQRVKDDSAGYGNEFSETLQLKIVTMSNWQTNNFNHNGLFCACVGYEIAELAKSLR